MSEWPTVGVAGARGLVGATFLSILADAGLPPGSLRAFGSEAGSLAYAEGEVPLGSLDDHAARELDVLFLATDAAASRQVVQGAGRQIPLIVDNSSAFRLDPDVPLVVPEANGHAAERRSRNVIANPNCTTAVAVVALAPIRDLAGLESVDLASYQAVSGAGRAGLDAFEAERAAGGTEQAPGSPFHGRIADSVVPQIDVLDDEGWSGEERKITAEMRKILELPDLDVAATAVRVPVRTGHSVALHVTTQREVPLKDVMLALSAAPGIEYHHATGSNRHPMPLDAAGRDPVLVGRLRAVPGRPRGLALFLSSDNLRKGAALNAIQVAACADPERFGRLVPTPR
jgi:aspartate-semialdehyde dehydrogenase